MYTVEIKDGYLLVGNRQYDIIRGRWVEGDIVAEMTESDEMLLKKVEALTERVERLEHGLDRTLMLLEQFSFATARVAEEVGRLTTSAESHGRAINGCVDLAMSMGRRIDSIAEDVYRSED